MTRNTPIKMLIDNGNQRDAAGLTCVNIHGQFTPFGKLQRDAENTASTNNGVNLDYQETCWDIESASVLSESWSCGCLCS